MPSFITNEWTAITAGAWYLRDVDTMRVRLEWSVDGDYMDVTSEDVLPGGPWRLKGVHVVSDDYIELHFKPEEAMSGYAAAMAAADAMAAQTPSKRELLAASLYGVVAPGADDYQDAAVRALAAADALIAEAKKK